MAMIEVNHHPSDGELRRFAVLQFTITCGVIGAVQYFRAHWPLVGIGFWTLGIAVALVGLVKPRLVRPVYLGMTYAAMTIALGVTYVFLAVLFYLVVFPVGLIMRLIGRDAMHRKFDPRAASYWIRHDPGASPKRYFSQF